MAIATRYSTRIALSLVDSKETSAPNKLPQLSVTEVNCKILAASIRDTMPLYYGVNEERADTERASVLQFNALLI